MTTEVFRNMLYDTDSEESELKDVFAVVFDEFHYMNDRDRGTVRLRKRGCILSVLTGVLGVVTVIL